MQQVLQRLDTGDTLVVDVPAPRASGRTVLVETRATLISAGTERMLVEFGRANLLQKVRQQPDKVAQVLGKMRTDGVQQTLEAVRAKLEAPLPLGYCNAGIVAEVGSADSPFAVGDRVVTNGSHADYVVVPYTLTAKIPDGVPYESAAFTPLAAIALQGIRLAEPTLGETVVVFGLGLVGLLTVQLLRANGCRVIGIDHAAPRLALAEAMGAIVLNGADGNLPSRVLAMTGGVGADAVLLTLSSDSDDPVRQSAEMSRRRGRLVLVGVTGLSLARDEFFKKELTFTVSSSYGPGRYDPSYEQEGRDYPIGFVRWTAQRNFDAVLALMQTGQIDPAPLISHRFVIGEAAAAYAAMTSDRTSLGVVLTYTERGGIAPAAAQRTIERSAPSAAVTGRVSVGIIGAGNFAQRTLLPALARAGVRFRSIASGSGTTAAIAAQKFAFERTTTDTAQVLDDPEVDTIFILTRHDSHAALAERALRAGKHVFVEKPLALRESDLDTLELTARETNRMLFVGFNRRFAPFTIAACEALAARSGPLNVVMTINAGAIPRDHWTQNPEVGGGRIAGEGCHWIDLARRLVGHPITAVQALAAHRAQGAAIDDQSHIMLAFADGSTAVLHYLAAGGKAFPKERIECFTEGQTLVIDNWRSLKRITGTAPLFTRSRKMDKGHDAEIAVWLAAVRNGGQPPIPLEELVEVSRWSLRAAQAVRSR